MNSKVITNSISMSTDAEIINQNSVSKILFVYKQIMFHFQCKRCNYSTNTKGNMKRHLFKTISICEDVNSIELTDEIKNEILLTRLTEDKLVKKVIKVIEKVIKPEPIIDEKTIEMRKKNKDDFTKIGIDIDTYEFKLPLVNKDNIITGYTIVDEEDFEKASKSSWYESLKYVRGNGGINNTSIQLHQLILQNTPDGMVIDHINGNKMDNRSFNLRFASIPQNGQNRESLIGSSSKYLGVSWCKKSTKWISQSHYETKNIKLGAYENEIDAAIRYDTFVLLYYGEKAKTNNLVKFEDVKDLDIKIFLNKKERDLPKFITNTLNSFRVLMIYKGIRYDKTVPSLDLAKEKLIEFQNLITKIKFDELELHNKREIIRNDNNIAIIPVNNKDGDIIDNLLVSDHRWHHLMLFNWCKSGDYFITRIDNKMIKIHRYIMDVDNPNIKVDHINHDSRNNTDENLRLSTTLFNNHNKKKKENTSSKYIGVSFKKNEKIWTAAICFENKKYYLGRFKNELDAAKVYNVKAIELYGDFANLNIFS
jgi:hypothetical protein